MEARNFIALESVINPIATSSIIQRQLASGTRKENFRIKFTFKREWSLSKIRFTPFPPGIVLQMKQNHGALCHGTTSSYNVLNASSFSAQKQPRGGG